MDIKTFEKLINWTRDLHENLASCLSHCATRNENERAQALLEYVAYHESDIARIVDEFEHQADSNTLETRVYDYLANNQVETLSGNDERFSTLTFDDISREVFAYHDQITDLYQTLIGKAEIADAKELLESLLAMEENESKRLASQIGRMQDI